MADAAVSTVVNKLSELAKEEVLLLVKVGKDVKVLGDKLEWLQTSLKDADQQRRASKSPYVALWVKQARDAAFEVEDVLDEFSRKVSFQLNSYTSLTVKDFISLCLFNN